MKNFEIGTGIDGDLFRGFSGMLDSFFREWGMDDRVTGMSEAGRLPVSINIVDSQAVITLELAGYSKENLSIVIQGNVVTISGNRDSTSFNKTFRVDTNRFNIESVEASYINGLLTVTLDKVVQAEPTQEKRTVIIQ